MTSAVGKGRQSMAVLKLTIPWVKPIIFAEENEQEKLL